MHKGLKIGLILFGLTIFGIIGAAYYSFIQIDYIGERDPKAVEKSGKRLHNILLSAEFRDGTNYYEIDLLDSINLEIRAGDNVSGTILNELYEVSNDTIKIIGGITQPNRYFNSDKLLIQGSRLLFKNDTNGSFRPTPAMTIKFNKINCS